MALITLAEVREAYGDGSDTSRDAIITQVLPFAEAAVQSYTHRTFQPTPAGSPATAKDFTYEESGVVTVDDFEHGSITSVQIVDALGTASALSLPGYLPQPLSGEFPVGWWIEVRPTYGISPEMGFLQNLDVYAREYGSNWARGRILRVTAKWGWPAVPGDVKQATIWTAIAFVENPQPYTSQAIASYSRTINTSVDAIPDRAKDLLFNYVKD